MFGDYPAVSPSKARELRDAARTNLADGLDPSETKQDEELRRREASGQTFEKLGAAFLTKQR